MSYHGSKKRNHKLQHLYNQTKNSSISGVYYNEKRKKLMRFYRRKISKYLKNQSNRRVRRMKCDVFQNGDYRKLYDYWWNLD